MRQEKLIEAQRRYIEFLGDQVAKLALFAFAHGMKTSDEDIQKGFEMRRQIAIQTEPTSFDIVNRSYRAKNGDLIEELIIAGEKCVFVNKYQVDDSFNWLISNYQTTQFQYTLITLNSLNPILMNQ